MNIKEELKNTPTYLRIGNKVVSFYFEKFILMFASKWFTFVGWLLILGGLHYVSLNTDSVLIDGLFVVSFLFLIFFLAVSFFKLTETKNASLQGLIVLIFLFLFLKFFIPQLTTVIKQLSVTNEENVAFSFEPQVYFARVIQVGGVGADIYTNRAYFWGDGSTDSREGWPIYLDKDTYARVSFNTPFYLMYLWCKDDYTAIPVSDDIFSAAEDKNGNSLGFGTSIEEGQMRSEITIKCQKK